MTFTELAESAVYGAAARGLVRTALGLLDPPHDGRAGLRPSPETRTSVRFGTVALKATSKRPSARDRLIRSRTACSGRSQSEPSCTAVTKARHWSRPKVCAPRARSLVSRTA